MCCGHVAFELSHACGPAFHIGCVGERLCGDGGAVVGPVALHWAGILCEERVVALKCWEGGGEALGGGLGTG